MRISEQDWTDYIDRLSRLNQRAGEFMRAYLRQYGTKNPEKLIQYANALVTKYGEGSAELAAQMYDAMAAADGVVVPAAEPAPVAGYGEVAKAVNGAMGSQPLLVQTVGRLVKQAGADTTLKNAVRDGAQFAWIPHGDTCPFCIVLASRGWQYASQKAVKNGHASHIHANCNCEYAVRFKTGSTVAGYDPGEYLRRYKGAGGDLNAMRRAQYAENRTKITAQKRAAYAQRKRAEGGE